MAPDSTVFVVDDDPAARASVAALVRSHGVCTEVFASAEEFLAAFDEAWMGCVVLDVRMNGMSGLELQSRLAARGATLPAIVITGHADVPSAVRAMENGAVTFLEKPCADRVLWANILIALERERASRPRRQQAADVQRLLATLSESEVQVLELLLAGKTNNMIAAELRVGIRTVELRRASILKKMGAESLPALVRVLLASEGGRKWRKPA